MRGWASQVRAVLRVACASPVKRASRSPAREPWFRPWLPLCSLSGASTSRRMGGMKTRQTEQTDSPSAITVRRGSGSLIVAAPRSAAHSGESDMSSSAVAASVSSRQKVNESW
eukprot:scaffold82725_cov57-Phaeocystis_antarctica.AAC.1